MYRTTHTTPDKLSFPIKKYDKTKSCREKSLARRELAPKPTKNKNTARGQPRLSLTAAAGRAAACGHPRSPLGPARPWPPAGLGYHGNRGHFRLATSALPPSALLTSRRHAPFSRQGRHVARWGRGVPACTRGCC